MNIDTPLVSEHFPRVPKGCETVADKFFTCFYENGRRDKDMEDSEIGNKALRKCESLVTAYNNCVNEAATNSPRSLFRVPEAYRVRDD